MICAKCQRIIQDDSLFCSYCGKNLQKLPRKATKHANGTGTVFKRGKTWTARVTVGWKFEDGHKVQIYRTKGGFPSKTAAENYCPLLKTGTELPRVSDTFYQIYERWKQEYEPRIAPVTMATYKAAWNHFSDLHYHPIVDITVQQLQNCINACDKGRSTLNDMRTVCSLVYKYAIINRIVPDNLAQFLYVNSKKKGTRDAFSADELEKIRKAVGKEPYADYVYFMCYTGFRPNEMLSLKKDAYKKDKNVLIGGFKTEAGKDRPVPVSAKIAPILAQRMASDSEYIFSRPDGTLMDDEHFRKYCFVPLMKKLGIEGKVPYSCRHTFANLLKNVRGSDTDKAALIGHSDASMTKYYQSPDYESLQAIIDNL